MGTREAEPLAARSQKLLTLDSRRRTGFVSIGRRDDRWYAVENHPDGTVVLTPVALDTDADLVLNVRRQANMRGVGKAEHRRYLAHEQPDGVVTLSPAVVVTVREMTQLSDAAWQQRIDAALAHPERTTPWEGPR